MSRIGECLLGFAVVFAAAISTAQAATVKEVFEQHNLLGTFALDCTKPASKSNLYYVHHAIDAKRVQRDQMSGPDTRDFFFIIEEAIEVSPNEIAVRGTRNGKIPTDSVYRVEPGRMRVIEAMVADKTVVTGGRVVNGGEVPWIYKCDAGGQQKQTGTSPSPAGSVKIVFEKHNLLGTFAWDCSKPVSATNHYFVNRLLDADHVQRDQMSGPAKRDSVAIIDRVLERNTNEIILGGTFNDQPSEGTWRLERNRQATVELTISGKKVVTDGKFIGNGQQVRWQVKCEQRGMQSNPSLVVRF